MFPINGLVCGSRGYISRWRNGVDDSWEPITYTPITNKDLYSVFIIDSLTLSKAYIVGQGGIILKTNNVCSFPAQPVFYRQSSPVTKSLNSVSFTSYSNGIAVGDTGTVVRTTDGGSHWSSLAPLTQSSLFSVQFPTANTGYAVGVNGMVIKTTDNGINWVIKTQPLNDTLRSVWFTSDNTGFVVSRNGLIYKTTDGGNSWQSKPSNTTQHLRTIQFYNANTGYAAGYNKVILKTTNAGENWVVQNANFTNHNYNCISIGLSAEVLVVGNNACAAGNFFDHMNINVSTVADFYFYPNPASNHFTISTASLPEKEAIINIYNSQGQLLLSESMHNQNTVTLVISHLPVGIYMAKIQTEKGLAEKKFVVVR
jgi:photosystem II stability/assembly factor-like uncharacterized protein